MANMNEDIKYWLNIINTATKGEDVRDAIIELLTIANKGVSDAYTLNGHPASDFALQSDMDTILPLASAPVQGGTKPCSSGGLYDFFYSSDGVITALNKVLEDDSSGTLASKIYKLGEIRKDIRDAINLKDKHIDPYDAFDTYADQIKEIVQNPNIELETINITDNGEFVADEDKGYKTVKVDVSKHMKEKTITTNGTYKAEDDEAYGYSKVTVELSTGSSGSGAALITKNIDASNLPETPQATTYKASEDSEGALGYSEVTVDVTGLLAARSEDIEIDPWSFEEETFKVSDELTPLYGWTSVTVKTKTPTFPVSVEFWNDSALLQTVSVDAPGQSAIYTGPTPTKSGMEFAGWSPDPINVQHKMKCYATFRDPQHHSTEHEIQLSWEDIGKTRGTTVNIGEYKILYYKAFTCNGTRYPGGAMCMMKVGENEENSKSSWLATEPLKDNYGYASFKMYNTADGLVKRGGWSDSDLRSALNNAFISAIAACSEEKYGNSGVITTYMCDVVKHSTVYDYNGEGTHKILFDDVTTDKIWIPSMYEMQNYAYHSSYDAIESAGPKYTITTEGVVLPIGYSQNISSGYARTIIDAAGAEEGSTSLYLETRNFARTSSSTNTAYCYKCSSSSPHDTSEPIQVIIGFCL